MTPEEKQRRIAILRSACKALCIDGRGGNKAMCSKLGISMRTLRHRLQKGSISDECLLAVKQVMEEQQTRDD